MNNNTDTTTTGTNGGTDRRAVAFVHGATSDVGRVRIANEDAHFAAAGTLAVADGLGGHNAGEVASEMAVNTVAGADKADLATPQGLGGVVVKANKEIHGAAAADPALRGMATTLTVATVLPGPMPRIAVANVGDSRTSIYRTGDLIQVSKDHSIVQEMVDRGEITAEQARVHPRGHILTRALGIEPDVEVDVYVTDVQPGDRLLLATDGLLDMVPAEDIAEMLWRHRDPQVCADALVERANENGGPDNITVVVADVVTTGA